MKLFFVENDAFEPPREAAAYVALGWRARRQLSDKGLDPLAPRELLAPLSGRIGEAAWSLATTWYVDEAGRDVTLFRGVSLASMYWAFIWNFFAMPATRAAALAEAALDKVRPDEVVCDAAADGFLKEALRALAGRRKIGFRFAGRDAPNGGWMGGAASVFSWRPPRPRAIDRWGRPLFAGLAGAIRYWRSRRHPGRVRVVAEYYPTLKSLFRSFARTDEVRFDLRTVEWPPSDLALTFLRRGYPVEPGRVRPRPDDLSEAHRIAEACERLNIPGARVASAWNGLPLWPIVREPLCAFISAHCEEGVGLVSRAERLLHDKPDVVLLPFDSMPQERALTEVARRIGIPVVTVMHGIGFVGRFVNDGFRSDFVAVEGAGTKRLYERAGRAPEKTIVGGAGIFDHCGPTRPGAPSSLRRNVLVLTNPQVLFLPESLPGDAEEYLVGVLSVLRESPGISVTVKLHPSESESYYADLLLREGLSATIVKHEIFSSVLARHGIVIGTASTALIESLAGSRWVTGVNWTGFPFPAPYDGSGGFPVARSPEELRGWLKSVWNEPPPAPEVGRVLADFAGALDGRQAERFLDRLAEFRS